MLVSSLVVPGWVAGAAMLEVVGGLPLLTPMSEIAGRLSVQHASQILLQTRGVLLGGIAGVEPAHVVVVGGGSAGAQAVDVAVGMGARVTVVDINTDTLRRFIARYDGRVECVHSTPENLAKACSDASVLVGADAGGVDAALDANPHLAQGVNVRGGEVVHEAIKTKT